jgi:hypothetical protein
MEVDTDEMGTELAIKELKKLYTTRARWATSRSV